MVSLLRSRLGGKLPPASCNWILYTANRTLFNGLLVCIVYSSDQHIENRADSDAPIELIGGSIIMRSCTSSGTKVRSFAPEPRSHLQQVRVSERIYRIANLDLISFGIGFTIFVGVRGYDTTGFNI